jgi:hypothetical protein
MPGPLLHFLAQVACPHLGQGLIAPSQSRVLVSGMPVATVLDQTAVVGCTFAPVAPHPCVKVQWSAPAAKVLVNFVPALLQTSLGTCLAADLAPQGVALVAGQPRVSAI